MTYPLSGYLWQGGTRAGMAVKSNPAQVQGQFPGMKFLEKFFLKKWALAGREQ